MNYEIVIFGESKTGNNYGRPVNQVRNYRKSHPNE